MQNTCGSTNTTEIFISHSNDKGQKGEINMVMLKRNEEIIRQEPVKMIVQGKSTGGGKLILTNKRVVFEKKGKGSLLGGGSFITELDADLMDIKNVTVAKPLIPIPFLTSNVCRIEFRGQSYEFGVKIPGEWKTAIFTPPHRSSMCYLHPSIFYGVAGYNKIYLTGRLRANSLSAGAS